MQKVGDLNMKKIAISIILITIFFINSNSQVYATDENTWVKDAFQATSDFLNEIGRAHV